MESALVGEGVKPNLGALQWSVRRLLEHEFFAIVRTGFGNELIISKQDTQVAEEPAEYNRPIVKKLTNRPFRNKAFSNQVHEAYDDTCAFTGLRLNNGAGLFEVEAAHIRAVEDNGPDSPRNGLALGQTIHWLFDKGVLSLEDDGKILKAGRLVPEKVNALLHTDGYARLPERAQLQPHKQFLRFHRENRFLG
ncbi:MAG: HNH endonuclease [Verrucomicrobiota bacterium]